MIMRLLFRLTSSIDEHLVAWLPRIRLEYECIGPHGENIRPDIYIYMRAELWEKEKEKKRKSVP